MQEKKCGGGILKKVRGKRGERELKRGGKAGKKAEEENGAGGRRRRVGDGGGKKQTERRGGNLKGRDKERRNNVRIMPERGRKRRTARKRGDCGGAREIRKVCPLKTYCGMRGVGM